jgi:glutamyl-tRNA synthetase
MAAVVGRLAPSPTGFLHLGHARTFLLAYWSARNQNGRLVLRLEDLDSERSTDPYVEATLRDLEWLGLDWDGAPRRQSAGVQHIRSLGWSLYQCGRAYPCFCTRADLRAAVSAPQEGTTELRYTGRCRGLQANLPTSQLPANPAAALRFLVPDGKVTVHDYFLGDRSFDVAAECGDFIILRRDQIPSYQLAVVVDDALDGVTEVVRGDDLLSSAARQQLLEREFSFATPRWIHVPLVVDEHGQRFAKRTDAMSLRALRERGVDPRTIVGWAARCSGWPSVERVTACELVGSFSWNRVPRTRVSVKANDFFNVTGPERGPAERA